MFGYKNKKNGKLKYTQNIQNNEEKKIYIRNLNQKKNC